MDELIYRDALLADIAASVVFSGSNSRNAEIRGANKIIARIKAAPTIDAVEVVRCRDCEVPHNRYTGCPNLNGLVTPHDFYCPFGERKEGAD